MPAGLSAKSLPSGAYTALLTPFSTDGSAIDWEAHERLIEAQLSAKIDGLVPCGTTGETPTLTGAEARELITRTVKLAAGKTFVLAGAGTNNTAASVDQARQAIAAGADAVMVVAPYYNRPNQEGLFRHIQTVAGSIDAPVVVYNIPGRTGVRFEVDTLCRLAEACANVVGLKDASNDVLDCQQLKAKLGDRLTIFSGDDVLTVPMMSVGASGVISVTSNVLPAAVRKVTTYALSGQGADALKEHQRLLPVHSAMFCAPNPTPVKAAASLRGLMHPSVRLPLVPLGDSQLQNLRLVLAKYTGGAA